MKNLFMALLLSLLFALTLNAQDDTYPSLTFGLQATSYVHDYHITFRGLPISNPEDYNDRLFIPTIFLRSSLPLKNNFVLLFDLSYTANTIKRFKETPPYGTTNPEAFIPEIFNGSVAIKYYFK